MPTFRDFTKAIAFKMQQKKKKRSINQITQRNAELNESYIVPGMKVSK